jgi:crotonobetainyl-CoA:carnitine CoA-transferase CaiB-like acyl-CoA transferase
VVVTTKRSGPLAGVRVLAIAKVWAGPYAAKMLALLGAEVIKIESTGALDEMRAYGGVGIEHAPYFLSQNTEILSARVNLKSAEGIAQLKAMIAQSDIVLDNLRPGALEKLGLGYADLKAVKPDIIHVSIKMYGSDGPLGQQTGYAPNFAAIGGLNYLVGHEGEAPKGMNIRYGDATAGAAAAFGAIVALHHRFRTGEGQFVDLSAVETISSLIGDSLFAYALTGQIPTHDGNFDPELSPHGAYPARDEAWISIACGSDTEWHALCGILGASQLTQNPLFLTHSDRIANRLVLDAAIGDLTSAQNACELGDRLRAAGVAAYPSASSLALTSDELLWAREAYRMVENGNGEIRPVVGAPWRITPDGPAIARGAPLLGEHDEYVYRDILGLSAADFAGLKANGAIS